MARKLIFKYRSNGTALPKYTYCKVYNDGTLEAGDGWLYDKKDEHHATKKLPRETIRDIQRIIDQNYKIFSIDKLEDTGVLIFDGTEETLYFSDEQQKCTFEIDNLGMRSRYERVDGMPETPNLDLVTKVYEEIRKILIKNGLSPEHF